MNSWKDTVAFYLLLAFTGLVAEELHARYALPELPLIQVERAPYVLSDGTPLVGSGIVVSIGAATSGNIEYLPGNIKIYNNYFQGNK